MSFGSVHNHAFKFFVVSCVIHCKELIKKISFLYRLDCVNIYISNYIFPCFNHFFYFLDLHKESVLKILMPCDHKGLCPASLPAKFLIPSYTRKFIIPCILFYLIWLGKKKIIDVSTVFLKSLNLIEVYYFIEPIKCVKTMLQPTYNFH